MLVVAEGRSDAHADQPAPLTTLCGRGIALRPAKSLRSNEQTLYELPLRKRPCRLNSGLRLNYELRIIRRRPYRNVWNELRIIQDPEFHWIAAQFLCHLIHCDFERHHAGRLPRSAHGVAFGKIEHRETRRRQPVRASVEVTSLLNGAFGLATSQVA